MNFSKNYKLKLKSILILILLDYATVNAYSYEEIDCLEQYKKNFQYLILNPLAIKLETDGRSIMFTRDLLVSKKGDFISRSDELVYVWDAETGRLKHILNQDGKINTIEMLSNGDLVTCSRYNETKIWDLETGRLKCKLDSFAKTLTISRDGDLIISDWNSVDIWDQKTYKLKNSFSFNHKCKIKHLVTLANGDIVSISGNLCKIWSPITGDIKFTLHHDDLISEVKMLSNGDIVTSSCDSTAKIWNAKTGQLKFSLIGHQKEINKLEILPDDDIVTGSHDGTVKIWDKTGILKYTLEQGGSIGELIPSKNSDIIIVECYEDNIIKIWNTKTGNLQSILDTNHINGVFRLQLLPNGDIISSQSASVIKL